MTDYGRSYTPPVFHTEKASTAQIKVMQVVFDTLQDSGIDFCIVQQSAESKKELEIIGRGNFAENEQMDIIYEVAEMYADDEDVDSIMAEWEC